VANPLAGHEGNEGRQTTWATSPRSGVTADYGRLASNRWTAPTGSRLPVSRARIALAGLSGKKSRTRFSAGSLPAGPDFYWPDRFSGTTNSRTINANIRRMRNGLGAITRDQATPKRQVGTRRLEDCPAENRVRLFFPDKPAKAIGPATGKRLPVGAVHRLLASLP